MRALTLLAVIFCVPWSPCYAQDFRWGRWESVTPWVPEQATAMERYVQPAKLPARALPAAMSAPVVQCKGCPTIKLPPAPK